MRPSKISVQGLSSPDLESTLNPEVTKACDGFLTEALALAPLEGVAVVLLDEERTTSRVVYTWQAGEPSAEARQTATEDGSTGGPPEIHSASMTLAGSAGGMGSVLMRFQESAEPLDLARFVAPPSA